MTLPGRAVVGTEVSTTCKSSALRELSRDWRKVRWNPYRRGGTRSD